MRRLGRTMSGLLAAGLITIGSLGLAATASAATLAATTTCSNGVDDTPGLGLICQVTIVNTITPSGGSATVTVHECHGAAGDPSASCSTTTQNLTAPVTAVTQCNAATNGGGGTLRCSVDVTNRFVGLPSGAIAATVNQCVGSGGGITIGCDPFPATTLGAAITQCNGSANGGTLVGLTCTATGTMSSSAGVTINQCNGSTNGGGALVICSANITNVVISPPTPAPSSGSSGGGPTPTPTRTPAPRPTAPAGGTSAGSGGSGGGSPGGGSLTVTHSSVKAPVTATEPGAPLAPGQALPLPLIFAGILMVALGVTWSRLLGADSSR